MLAYLARDVNAPPKPASEPKPAAEQAMSSPAKENSTLVASLRSRVASLEEELSDTREQLATAKQSLSESNARCEALKGQLAAAPGPAAVAAGAAAASTPAAAAPSSLEPGKGLGSLPEMSFLSPRGKFGVKLCESALVLQGKAASVVVPYASIESMWAVPEVDERGFLFACTLSAPVVHGKSQLSGLSFITKPTDKEASLTLPDKAAAKGSVCHRGLEPCTSRGRARPGCRPRLQTQAADPGCRPRLQTQAADPGCGARGGALSACRPSASPGRPLTRVPALAPGRPRTFCSSASRTSRPGCARGDSAASARRR
jgi:hypothetical protein